jgi:hypothetical protein
MFVHQSDAWKLALALLLGVGIVLSLYARAPKRAIAEGELRRLVIAAVILYAVGAVAWITHHPALAGLVFAAGISTAALAAWLSRGRGPDDRPSGRDTADPEPPSQPTGFDWDAFEREFWAYSERSGNPIGRD